MQSSYCCYNMGCRTSKAFFEPLKPSICHYSCSIKVRLTHFYGWNTPKAYSRPFNLHLDFWNQGLEKSSSVSNLRKISGPAHLDFFFQFITWIFFRFLVLIFQDLDFQKSRCKLKGRVAAMPKLQTESK